jgi:hypothetical protein
MADKARKRPARPADPEAPAQPVEALPPAHPPPQKIAHPVAQLAEPVLPRNADDVLHNIIVAKLADEVKNPPPQEPENLALKALSQVMLARQSGASLVPFRDDISRQISGGEELDKMSWHLYRRYRSGKLLLYLQADNAVDQFLMRVFNRGGFSPTELLVLKRLIQAEVKSLSEELIQELREGAVELNPDEALTKLDYTLRTSEVAGHSMMSQTTPQGREIVRKLVFTAKRKLYPPKAK